MIGVGGLRKFFPAMHIHHCASYEVSAIKRLNERRAARDAKIDEPLSNVVFIDLNQRWLVDRQLRKLDRKRLIVRLAVRSDSQENLRLKLA